MGASGEAIDELYRQFRADPQSVEESWRHFFMGMEFSGEEAPSGDVPKDLKIERLIETYRTFGHRAAQINPIAAHPVEDDPLLDLRRLGFSESELDESFPTMGFLPSETAPLREIVAALRQIYCGRIGFEYMGYGCPEIERWIQERVERHSGRPELSIEEKKKTLECLNKAELFEIFLHTKYVGQKRFSLEGGEMLIPVMQTMIEKGASLGIEEYVIGMAHRGRLSVLANILNKSYGMIFHEFEDTLVESSFEGSGDVKYHKGFSADIKTDVGPVHLSLAANPSHLESVNAIVEGEVRAKQVLRGDDVEMKRVVPLLIHGDASLPGQGVVYETMQLSKLKGYGTGGSVHLVVNNQIGFTTLPKDSRSTRYCTDIAKAFSAPVFHVDGTDAEGCVFAALMAIELRQRFGIDVFIDINCWRKYGHNESDEPAFTQPLEYQIIRKLKSPREIYRDELIEQGVLERQMAEALEAEFKQELQTELDQVQSLSTEPVPDTTPPKWQAIRQANRAGGFEEVETAVSGDLLRELAEKFCAVPEGMVLHRKIKKLAEDRRAMVEGPTNEAKINWGMGEHLAYATLLWEGRHIRLSGQDSRRGTFNHRHAMWKDQEKEWKYFPLNHLKEGQGRFDVFNSSLSERGVLGFDFGYAGAYPEALVIWEAQFGDFANCAQVLMDQYISTCEQKWGELNGVTLFLPHGYEGQGPEHSSARIERYLQLAGDNNMRVAQPTTPAQLFHVLRSQVLRTSRKPLIVFTPKGLLGDPMCLSSLDEFSNGKFHKLLDDPKPPTSCKKLVFCSGRVYYHLAAEREKRGVSDVALVRIEQLYPCPIDEITGFVEKYPGEIFWVQDEPENMGAWDFFRPCFAEMIGKRPHFIGRPRSASPATGSPKKHKAQQAEIFRQLFGESL